MLLKEWKFLPLYERQVLWNKQKERKLSGKREEGEANKMVEASFKPFLFSPCDKPLASSFVITPSYHKPESYSELYAKRLSSAKKRKTTTNVKS
jgi:hypothetical protein